MFTGCNPASAISNVAIDIGFTYKSISNTKVIFVLILYCASGTLLTIFNKLAIAIFPYPHLLLLLQNGITIILLLLFWYLCDQRGGSLPVFSFAIIQRWLPLVIMFLVMLTSSLFALRYVSIATFIVMRNLTTLSVALLEYLLLNNQMNRFSMITLILMLLGALLYARHDITFSIPGYCWLSVNIISTSTYQIYIKKVIHYRLFENIGPLEMSYYNNVISLPFLMVLACIMGEFKILTFNFDNEYTFDLRSFFLIMTSGILGFLLSASAFTLNKLISATSMMVANNANKFSMIVISEIFIQSSLDIGSSMGAIAVLLLGCVYSQTAKSSFKRILFAITLCLGITVAFAEFTKIKLSTIDPDFSAPLLNIDSETLIIERSQQDQIKRSISSEKLLGEEIYKQFLPMNKKMRNVAVNDPGIIIKGLTTFNTPPICKIHNSSIWKICNATICTPYIGKLNLLYPQETLFGENTDEFIHRVLEAAWGSNPPSIDLYVRSGCNGIMEMKYLFKSLELFWPRFLGSIIIILDAGDETILQYLLPQKPTHRYLIRFEHIPCISPRVFNQYSYLNVDQHSKADFIVTIDSDCVFHSPVTPDLIFRQGKVILASSKTFQYNLWLKPLESMMGVGMYDRHYMVTQPVTFARSTFSSFRRWFYLSKGRCYQDQLSILSADNYGFFCWMCQLGTFLERGNPEQTEYDKYWFQHFDDDEMQPILRYAVHVTYEPYRSERCDDEECYAKSASMAIQQGLCRAFGSSVFHICRGNISLEYVNNLTFFYAHSDIQAADKNKRMITLTNYLSRLSQMIMLVRKA